MSQTTLVSTITKTGTYPVKVPVNAEYNCGTLQLILGNIWSNQMIHELPTINISLYTPDEIKFLSFDIDMSVVNEELIKLEPTSPYFIPIYGIPKDSVLYVTPLFDKLALSAHNDVIESGNIEIFNTSDSGIVDSNESSYSSELWTIPTSSFDVTIVFDNDNISSGGGEGGGTPSEYVDAVKVLFDNTGTNLTSSNVQDALVELDQTISDLPEPMVFKGSLGVGGTITSLPTASSANKGFTYKVITDGTYAEQSAKVGDTFISDGASWILIPSGDEPSGTVTSVEITGGEGISVTGTPNPITTSGTLNVSLSDVIQSGNKGLYNIAYNSKGQIVDATKITTFTFNCSSNGLDGTPETYKRVMKDFFDKNDADHLAPKDLTNLVTEWYKYTRDDWNGYTTFVNSGTSTGTKGGSNFGLVCEPSTDTVAGQDDYAGLPLFYPIDVNFEIDADTKDIIITGIDGITTSFERDNPDKFVGVMQMSGYVWHSKDTVNNTFTDGYASNYYDKADECYMIPEARRIDGTYREFIVHTKYLGKVITDTVDNKQKLKSYSGVIPTSYSISHNTLNTYGSNNGPQYSGGSVLLLSFLQIMTRLKYASLTLDGIIQGCVQCNYQYTASAAETGVKRILLTPSKAANLEVGMSVLLGTVGSSNNVDRGEASVYSISTNTGCLITQIGPNETIGGTELTPVYVDTANTFNTTGDGTTTTGNTIISTYLWKTGTNDNILGNDGSIISASSGKYPAKLQGIEYSYGAYEVFGDIILQANPSTTEYKYGFYDYYICKDASKRSTSITSDYVKLSTILPYPQQTTSPSWRYISEITFDNGVTVPSSCSGGSSTTYERDGFYFMSTPSTKTTREWLSFGSLNLGVGLAGLSSVPGTFSLSSAHWTVSGRASCVEAFWA